MDEEFLVVKTKQGLLRGLRKPSTFYDTKYWLFRGIPYGKPPIGDLRFKVPVRHDNWEGVRDALKDGNDCKQQIALWERVKHPESLTMGDEDCLYLNVSTREVNGSKPVMVFIHGGGFAGGTGNTRFCGTDFLMEEDLVVVTINYRCGSFGFLTLGTEDVPGNAGLKDQVLALRWVQDNIANFGGDPNNVTLFGISAGGASVHYHLLSPLSSGLFHKAIIQSGSALNSWAVQDNPMDNTLRLAQQLGCHSQDPVEVLSFLQSVSADELVVAEKAVGVNQVSNRLLGLVFTPCVEVVGTNAFLTCHPEILMRTGAFQNVPIIQGAVASEGSVLITGGHLNDEFINAYNDNSDLFSSYSFEQSDIDKKVIGSEVKAFYMQDQEITWDNMSKFTEYLSDITINEGMSRTRAWLVQHSSQPVYSYLLTNHSLCLCHFLKSLVPRLGNLTTLKDTCHGGDFMYLFSMHLTDKLKTPELSEQNTLDIRRMTKAWTNFALSGDPNFDDIGVTWSPDSLTQPKYVTIDEHWALNEGIAFDKRMKFWSELRANHVNDIRQ